MSKKTLICHITHIDNIENILKNKFIYSPNEITNLNLNSKPICHVGIQEQRAVTSVPCGPMGNIHDYVPFYFGPRSPMLYAIKENNVEDYNDGQKPIIYICSNAEKVAKSETEFVFTDGHAIMVPLTHYYEDLKYLDKIDWEVIRGKYWFDSAKYPDRKRERQNEFLVYKQFSAGLIDGIIVIDKQIQNKVNSLLQANEVDLPVKICRNWYY